MLWLIGLVSFPACNDPAPSAPDVLLISLDSVRSDFLTFIDADTAPNLTRIASRGTIFNQAISGTSWTLPSHLQMFTGMPPVLHGVQESDQRLDPRITTLPRYLKQAGYNTAGFYTCWYLAAEYGFGDGFDLYQNSMRGGVNLEETLKQALQGDGSLASRRKSFKRSLPTDKYINSPDVVRNAKQALEQMGSADPVFLFAHLFDPHFDYIPPAPFDTAFDPEYAGDINGKDYWKNKRIYDPAKSPARQVSERDLDHVRALYRGEIAWTDAAIGKLLDELEARGRLDNTLIIVTADHGEEFFEHDERGHRHTLYDEVLRVPLLVVPPRGMSTAPNSCEEQVSLSDILPTILDYAKVDAGTEIYGRSLRPAVENQPLESRAVVASLALPMNDPVAGQGRGLLESLRTPTHKLTRYWVQAEEQAEPRLLRLEYFDLVTDPKEMSPIRTLDNRRVRKAWRQLEEEMDQVRTAWSSRQRTPVQDLFTDVESLVGDDLTDLGYAAGAEPSATESRVDRLGMAPLASSRLSAVKQPGK
ncbi:MAG: arylsulfatase A-like enzyme [Candidatus Paceibacteria bacterium]|jgi:arylsulfatase A-like enzyme